MTTEQHIELFLSKGGKITVLPPAKKSTVKWRSLLKDGVAQKEAA